STHGMRNIRSWHLQTTLFERRSPPFQHVGIHPFSTSASMLAEGGMFSHNKPLSAKQRPFNISIEHCCSLSRKLFFRSSKENIQNINIIDLAFGYH
ncbi:MAG: hypothetical protein IKD33_02745, partial [Bacteroidales bacterium]|nr:hypothetical protein [Bacteroidales bacterium]